MKQQLDYVRLLKKSLFNLRDHLVLFLPFIFGILIFLVIGVFVVLEGLFMMAFFSLGLQDMFLGIVSSAVMISVASLFIFIDLLLIFIFSSYLTGMVYAGFYNVAVHNKVNLDIMRRGASRLFIKVFKLLLIRFALYFIPLLILGGITTGIFLINWILGVILGIIFFMMYIVYTLYISLGMFFIGPMIVYKKKSLMEILRDSFKYLHKHTSHVLLTWVVMLCLGLAAGILIGVIILPLQFTVVIVPLIFIPVIMIRIIIQLVVAIYSNFFVFNSYFTVNKVKN